MTQSEDPRNLGGVNQVLGIDAGAHDGTVTLREARPNSGSLHLETPAAAPAVHEHPGAWPEPTKEVPTWSQ
jgi:hypothetical protein